MSILVMSASADEAVSVSGRNFDRPLYTIPDFTIVKCNVTCNVRNDGLPSRLPRLPCRRPRFPYIHLTSKEVVLITA